MLLLRRCKRVYLDLYFQIYLQVKHYKTGSRMVYIYVKYIYIYIKTGAPLIRFLLHLGTANKFLVFYPFTDTFQRNITNVCWLDMVGERPGYCNGFIFTAIKFPAQFVFLRKFHILSVRKLYLILTPVPALVLIFGS